MQMPSQSPVEQGIRTKGQPLAWRGGHSLFCGSDVAGGNTGGQGTIQIMAVKRENEERVAPAMAGLRPAGRAGLRGSVQFEFRELRKVPKANRDPSR